MGTLSTATLEGELLDVAHRAARAAGAELMLRWRKPLEVATKTTHTDPVTAADVAAETAIRNLLARERPRDSILGEEGGDTLGVAVRDGVEPTGLRWIVDPLDGTVNYMYELPNFVVSVAVEDALGTIAGVVLDPVHGEWFAATRHGQAVYSGNGIGPGSLRGTPIRSSSCESLEQALVATGFAYSADVRSSQGRVVARLLPMVRDIRRAGAAALDLGWAACGRVDAYYERGVKPWDIAAGVLICSKAGLVVRELEVVPASATGPELPAGILVAPPALVDELYELVTVDPVTWLLQQRG